MDIVENIFIVLTKIILALVMELDMGSEQLAGEPVKDVAEPAIGIARCRVYWPLASVCGISYIYGSMLTINSQNSG